MEQEETYIPYKERTPKELCRDINIRAEEVYLKLSKKDKYALLFTAVVLLVCVALCWHNYGYVNWWWLCVWSGIIGVVFFVFFKINQKLINNMYLAPNPTQHLRLAKRLKMCLLVRYIFLCVLGFWFGTLGVRTSLDGELWYAVGSFICMLIGIWLSTGIHPNFWIDSELNDDLAELEYRLEE